MRKHGLPGIHARNTAMMEAITDLPPIIVSDLFGVHPNTAYVWAQTPRTAGRSTSKLSRPPNSTTVPPTADRMCLSD